MYKLSVINRSQLYVFYYMEYIYETETDTALPPEIPKERDREARERRKQRPPPSTATSSMKEQYLNPRVYERKDR